MRQKSKQFILMLCTAACLCFISACGSQNSSSSLYLDPSLSGSISQVSESLLEQICSFSAEDAPLVEEELRQQRQSVLADGVAEWAGVQSDTGDFVRAISSQVTMEDSSTYVCTVNAEFELRNVEFRIYYTFTSDSMGLEPSSMSFTPEYTIGEKMQKAFLNMILGMGLVFVILIFLSFVIRCFKYIDVIQDRFRKDSRLPEGTGASVAHADTSVVRRVNVPAKQKELSDKEPAEAVPVAGEPMAEADDLELIAVITAAIAASEDIPADGLRVRSIRRLPGSKWKNS